MLAGAVLLFLAGMPSDRRGVEENLSSAQRGQTGGLRVPLIPANQNSDPSVPGLPDREAEISGREIEFFMVERIVRNMHLAIFPEIAPVGIENGGGIVVDAGSSALEQRENDDYA